MTLSITNSQASMIPMEQQNTTNRPLQEAADVKQKFTVNLNNREERVTTHVTDAFDRVSTRLDAVEQFAEDNDYSHLASHANKAMDNVQAVEQRVTGNIEHRFNIAQKLLEQRPEGGYTISEDQAESMIEKIEQNTEVRMAALNERSNELSARFDKIEQKAIDNGFEGDHINALRDKAEEHMENRVEHVELRFERAIELIQSRLDESYNIPSETDETDEQTNVHV